MDKYNLLDCTLRDGGYITNWFFGEEVIRNIITCLVDANIDFIECGYINNNPYQLGSACFDSAGRIGGFIPKDRKNSIFLAMADAAAIGPEDITPYDGTSVDGIRVVFYKNQVEEALNLCKAVIENGYKLIVQPMVTIDYSLQEYAALSRRIAGLNPYAVSIVDSFGYMVQRDFRSFFSVLDNIMPAQTNIGFHSHNNMQLAFITAQDILSYNTTRCLIIDASMYGMGRGAGNLNTELIANYYNMTLGDKYDLGKILESISGHIMPLTDRYQWGYSPYFFLTGFHKCHPNFASYLLERHSVSVSEFGEFIKSIPVEKRRHCRPPLVEEYYQNYLTLKGG